MHNLFHRRSKIEENPEKFWRELITKNDILQIASFLPKDAVWKLARFRQGECLDKRFNTITPYTEKEYQELLDAAASVIPGTELR